MFKRLAPLKVALIYAAFAALWIVVSSKLPVFAVDDAILQGDIELAKGMFFVAVTSGLLYLLLKGWLGTGDNAITIQNIDIRPFATYRLMLLFVALVSVVPLIGVTITTLYGEQIEHEAYANLKAIVNLKAEQIENWLNERRGDSIVLTTNTGFAEEVEQFKRHKDSKLQEAILSHLGVLKDANNYASILLFDTNGRLIFLLGDKDDRPPALQEQQRQAIASKTVQFGNLYRDETGNIHLDWVAPIIVSDAEGRHVVATVVLRVTAQQFLFPLIQTWPTTSPSAETILVRREGEFALYLNTLRHRANTALSLSLPLTQQKRPSVVAVRSGKSGITKGFDYRNIEVLTAYRPIKDTNWYLIAKIDREEVLSPLRELVLLISLIAFVAIVAISIMLLMLWRHQQREQNLELLVQKAKAESELSIADASLQQSMERTQALVNSALDAVVSIDRFDKVIAWNPQAEIIFGYSPEQALGREVAELIVPPANRNAHRQGIARFIETSTATIIGNRIEIQAMRADGTEFPVELTVLALTQNNEQFFTAYIRDITERKKAEETIYELAYYDPLTRLPNRRLMLDRLQRTLISRTLKSRHGAILFINLDNFRTLNDTKGHAVGDLLLVAVTRHLQNTVHVDDTVARIGSDEFVVLLDALDVATDLAAAQAESVAKRILAVINQPFDLQGYEYRCSASIGITLFRGNDVSVDDLVKHADLAMHEAKQSGQNIIRFFDPAVQAALESRFQLEHWMRKALNNQYKLYYQIQVDDQYKAVGAEALIRWHHPDRGIISPADFIPLAEETGLILSIGQWVLETACTQLKTWEHNQNTRHLILAVNVSAKQFRQPDFVEQVLAVLAQTGAAPHKLKLELTESMLVHNVEDIIDKMNELKIKGVRFSLDDFGTGFSSLTYLKRLPLNQLKIDQSFVHDALTDPNDAAITCTIITLGQSLEMEVIAEGVETEAHRSFLAAHGCHHYQGYLFSKPLPLEEFENYCASFKT